MKPEAHTTTEQQTDDLFTALNIALCRSAHYASSAKIAMAAKALAHAIRCEIVKKVTIDAVPPTCSYNEPPPTGPMPAPSDAQDVENPYAEMDKLKRTNQELIGLLLRIKALIANCEII